MSNTFRITVDRDESCTVLTMFGYLDIATSQELQDAVAALDDSVRGIVLDLAGVDFIDSSGLRALLDVERVATAADRTFSIVRPSANAVRLMEMTGLLEALHVQR